MTNPTAKTKKAAVVPIKAVPIEQEPPVTEEVKVETPHTLTLKGKGIEVKRDFSHLQRLDRSKLMLVDKYGTDVRKSAYLTDWDWAWFTDEDINSPDLAQVGWEKVHKVFGDNVKGAAQPNANRKDAGQIQIGGGTNNEVLVAYCVPKERRQEYLDMVQKTQVLDADALATGADTRYREGEDVSPETSVTTSVTEDEVTM